MGFSLNYFILRLQLLLTFQTKSDLYKDACVVEYKQCQPQLFFSYILDLDSADYRVQVTWLFKDILLRLATLYPLNETLKLEFIKFR